ncbi:Protein kinase-like domain [Pseudocohnilembus persalinus]|uniref:Protein kinase-like domain n=1 Tax=Pseudocohnilembus persalinus TaxID=266149 RepID=A0A0V0Q996_PSEPJ|nr:Protein kinase-like domain [Pseudocohnilembus persalinus]|eukprot:KRW98812.1 Protein kinase-like domain [Pseudocohnilembus persalinus]
MAYFMANLIKQLKEIGITHNNLAPENIFFKNQNNQLQITLGNFEYCIQKKTTFKKMYARFDTDLSNLKYKAPEIYQQITLSEQHSEIIQCDPILSDMFSLGLILKEIQLNQIIQISQRQQITSDLSFKNTLEEMFTLILNENTKGRIKPKKLIEYCQNLKNQIQTQDNENQIFELNGQNFLQYDEYDFQEMGEEQSDISLLLFIKQCRKIQLFQQLIPFLAHLKKKYVDTVKKNNNPKQNQLKFITLYELANYYRDIGENQNAVKFYQNTIQMIKQNNSLGTQMEQAYLYFQAAQLFQGGITWFKQSISIMRKILQTGNPKMAKVIITYGEACQKRGELQSALHIFQEASIVLKSTIGFNGLLGIQLLDKLGQIYFQLSEYSNALQFFQNSFSQKIQLFEPDHIQLAETLNNCGECLRNLGIYEIAIDMYQKALRKVWKKGENCQKLRAQLYNNMGICLKQRGLIAEACLLFEESYRIKKSLFGEADETTLATLLNVATIQDQQGCHTKSIQFYQEIVEKLKQNNQTNIDLYYEALQNMGIAYFSLQHYSKSTQYLNEALNFKKQKYGNMHVSVGITLQNLALVIHRQGQYKKAAQYFQEVIKIFTKKFGPSHELLYQVQQNYAYTKKFL